VGEVANMAGVVLAVPVAKRLGKKNTYILAMAGSALLSAAFCYVPLSTGGFRAMLLLQVLISVFAGMTFPLLWSMYADVADYSEYRHGSGSTGLIFSSSSMAQKFGGAFGSALILWLLAAYGYDTSPAAAQTPEALAGLRMLMSWIPAAGCVLAAVAVCFYPLGERRMAPITAELERRRQNR
ncbi:MAG: MFS transporter, partial [Alistipes sp.]|nr:MFS transporter [Alistipes sp.]